MEDELFDLMIGDPVLVNEHYNSIAGFEFQQERAKVRFCSPDSIIVETLSGKIVPCRQSNIEFVKMSPEVAIQIGLTKIDDVTYRAGTPDNQHYITVEFDKEGNEHYPRRRSVQWIRTNINKDIVITGIEITTPYFTKSIKVYLVSCSFTK